MKRIINRIYEWFLMTFTKHKIGRHGAVMIETKNGSICAECGKPVKINEHKIL